LSTEKHLACLLRSQDCNLRSFCFVMLDKHLVFFLLFFSLPFVISNEDCFLFLSFFLVIRRIVIFTVFTVFCSRHTSKLFESNCRNPVLHKAMLTQNTLKYLSQSNLILNGHCYKICDLVFFILTSMSPCSLLDMLIYYEIKYVNRDKIM
jgi:hypothetical protein